MYELGVGSVSGYKLRMYFYCIIPSLRGSPERAMRGNPLYGQSFRGHIWSSTLCGKKRDLR